MALFNKSRQDYRWTQISVEESGSPAHFYRLACHEFRSPLTFERYYSPNKFDALEEVIAKLPTKRMSYVMGYTGQLDVGCGLSGEPECFMRKEPRKSKKLRLGINPSNAGTRANVDHYKAAAYVAVIKAARRMGYLVEAEMCYGGMSDKRLDSPGAWSLRVELGTTLPAHVLAAYGADKAIDETVSWSHAEVNRQFKDGINISHAGCHYQTQDLKMSQIIADEYDICFHRLTYSDTPETMREFLKLQLSKLSIRDSDIDTILEVVATIR